MYEHDELTYAIIGAAIAVHSELGPGLLEHIYENAMSVEFAKRGIRFEKQKRMSVTYQGEIVGEFYADLVVENKVIVELKSVKDLADIHKAQLITYLKVAKIKTGLLINFNVLSIKKGINRISV
ncbi:MAG: GxxExxY protein [Chloroflexi bacterium]|nr:GxxExxY protein [Chloroflexota bacterium]